MLVTCFTRLVGFRFVEIQIPGSSADSRLGLSAKLIYDPLSISFQLPCDALDGHGSFSFLAPLRYSKPLAIPKVFLFVSSVIVASHASFVPCDNHLAIHILPTVVVVGLSSAINLHHTTNGGRQE